MTESTTERVRRTANHGPSDYGSEGLGFESLQARRSKPQEAIALMSATLENEADPTLENEATGSCLLVCRVLGLDAGQGVDPAVA